MDKVYLSHHGVKGQRWGIRRFQNEDGSLTPLGKKRYDVNEDGTVSLKKSYQKSQNMRGLVKTAIGASVVAKNVEKLVVASKTKGILSTKNGQKSINNSVLSLLLGSIVIGSGVKNFVNSYSNRTFNSTGMGATPELFEGKPKTRNQVIEKQSKEKS